jgi:hypothetical protein
MYLEFKTALNMFNLSRVSDKLKSVTSPDVSEGMIEALLFYKNFVEKKYG